jgi:hypothetical protein
MDLIQNDMYNNSSSVACIFVAPGMCSLTCCLATTAYRHAHTVEKLLRWCFLCSSAGSYIEDNSELESCSRYTETAKWSDKHPPPLQIRQIGWKCAWDIHPQVSLGTYAKFQRFIGGCVRALTHKPPHILIYLYDNLFKISHRFINWSIFNPSTP